MCRRVCRFDSFLRQLERIDLDLKPPVGREEALFLLLRRRVLAAEMGLNEPDYGHNIADCIAMADTVIDNRGSLPDLRSMVLDFVGERVPAPQ